MAGFNPVGSRPIGSIGSSDLPGTYPQPAVGDLVLSGVQGALIGVSPINVYETARETLQSVDGTQISVGETARETLEAFAPGTVRGHLVVRETLIGTTTGTGAYNASVSIIW